MPESIVPEEEPEKVAGNGKFTWEQVEDAMRLVDGIDFSAASEGIRRNNIRFLVNPADIPSGVLKVKPRNEMRGSTFWVKEREGIKLNIESHHYKRDAYQIVASKELLFKVDFYHGDLEGLVIAEAFFKSQDKGERATQMAQFLKEKPDWLGPIIEVDNSFRMESRLKTILNPILPIPKSTREDSIRGD